MSEPGITFRLGGILPGPNQLRRFSAHERDRVRVQWRGDSKYGATNAMNRAGWAKGSEQAVVVIVVFRFRKHRRRDWDNLYASLKPVLDGLVDAGVMLDDNVEVLRSLTAFVDCPADTDEVVVNVKRETP